MTDTPQSDYKIVALPDVALLDTDAEKLKLYSYQGEYDSKCLYYMYDTGLVTHEDYQNKVVEGLVTFDLPPDIQSGICGSIAKGNCRFRVFGE